MCGIIGYIGKNVQENLIEGLVRLEYRGYDSSGMAVLHENDFYVEKAVGPVENLKNRINGTSYEGIGIAHTRWATHGEISIENCHPHFSSDGDVALVHNGIIENFEDLRMRLEKKGEYFYGQTDSEVVAKLFGKSLTTGKVKKVLNMLKGSYAFAMISKKNKNIFFAKNKSPLYVARGDDFVMIASDPNCFAGKCDDFYAIEDGEYGKISLSGLEVYDKDGNMVEKSAMTLNLSFESARKEEYPHFMIKEINESRDVLNRIIDRYQTKEMFDRLRKITLKKFSRIYFVGCGTAYHAGLIGERYFKERFKIEVFSRKASEFLYQNDILDEKSLCVFISQSGETADTISALEMAKKYKTTNIGIVNTEYSTIAKKCDIVLPICAGEEKAVASTKAYFGQCLVLFILASYLGGEGFLQNFTDFYKQIDYGDEKMLKAVAKFLSGKEKVFFIGRGFDYITALEASLKLKEITYIFSYAECSGELKHGTLALIDEDVPVIVIANDSTCFNKTLNNAYEVRSRGGELILISSIDIDDNIKDNFKYIIEVNKCENDLTPLQTILSLQKLAYFTSIERGINPDKPRNLAKSVTVE